MAHSERVAIIGMSARFAGCENLDQFWELLKSGQSAIGSRRIIGSDSLPTPKPVNRPVGERVSTWGEMPNRLSFEKFRQLRENVPVEYLAPQHGLLFEALHRATLDGGYSSRTLSRRTSVFANYARTTDVPRGEFDDVYLTDSTFAAPLFSYIYDLRGQSVMLDSTCAGGMAVVAAAVSALQQRSCDQALVGSVSVLTPFDGSYYLDSSGVLSPDGLCRPFDAAANGTVPGDGCAALLLKREIDAIEDEDYIYAAFDAVLLNNDGSSKHKFTSPSVEGKTEVLTSALTTAGIHQEQVDYIEAHGVGIPVNDQIEASAICDVFGEREYPLLIGSIKGSIGHTDAAASLAAIIKVALSIEHRFLPATANTNTPIPEFTGAANPSVLLQGEQWTSDSPVAGVISAGIGGTNGVALMSSTEEPKV